MHFMSQPAMSSVMSSLTFLPMRIMLYGIRSLSTCSVDQCSTSCRMLCRCVAWIAPRFTFFMDTASLGLLIRSSRIPVYTPNIPPCSWVVKGSIGKPMLTMEFCTFAEQRHEEPQALLQNSPFARQAPAFIRLRSCGRQRHCRLPSREKSIFICVLSEFRLRAAVH